MSSPRSRESGSPDAHLSSSAYPFARAVSGRDHHRDHHRDHDPGATWLGPGFGRLADLDASIDLDELEDDGADTDPDDLWQLPPPPPPPPLPLMPPVVTTLQVRRRQTVPLPRSGAHTIVWRRSSSSGWRIAAAALITLALATASALASHYLFSRLFS